MSDARTAMERVFEDRRHALDETRAAALTELAESVRGLAEAVVLTDVDATEARLVATEAAVLIDRLSTVRRVAPPTVQMDADGVVSQLASPVTGELNPIAPPITITVLPDGTTCSEFTLSAVYEGPPGFVHGGVSAMILDHLLGCAAAVNGTPGMTAGLTMRYRRPTPYGVPLTAEAKAARTEGRKTFVEGCIVDPDGRRTAEATGVFIMPSG